jgi:large subunit ribosomal protein L29
MKTKELKNQSAEQLAKSVLELQKKLSDLRFTLSSNQLKNVKEMRDTKKNIARMLTIMQEYKKLKT